MLFEVCQCYIWKIHGNSHYNGIVISPKIFNLIYAHMNVFVLPQGPRGLVEVLAPMPVVMQPHHRLYHYNNTSQPSKG